MNASIFRNITTPFQGKMSRLSHSATHSAAADAPDIIEVDEEGDIENGESKLEVNVEHVQGDTSPNLIKKDELLLPNKEVWPYFF